MDAEKQTKNTGKRGGWRGGGRPKGSKDRATIEQKATLSELAKQYTSVALQALVDVATRGKSESARVSAASALLDRGYGKPVQAMSHENADGTPMAWPALVITRSSDDG